MKLYDILCNPEFHHAITSSTSRRRAVLQAARMKQRRGRDLDPLQAWALKVQDTRGHNKAACALANKLARICYATLRDKTPFGETERLNKKITRGSFVILT